MDVAILSEVNIEEIKLMYSIQNCATAALLKSVKRDLFYWFGK